MSATAPRASTATTGTVPSIPRRQQGVVSKPVDELGVAPSLLADARLGALVMAEGRRRVVTRVFGIPRDEQSFLVTLILTGAAATVLGGFVPRPRRPSGADAAIGGSVLNAALGGIAGAPARNMPLAGALIGFALVSHSLRPTVAESARQVRAMAHGVRAALRGRYSH